jgi:hypothetical protein
MFKRFLILLSFWLSLIYADIYAQNVSVYQKTKDNSQFDLVVYGATPAGISAAIYAAGLQKSVLLVESTNHIGGLTSGGLSDSDFRTYEAVQGSFRGFMDRVVNYYGDTYGENSQQVTDSWGGAYYEPKVAQKIFIQMLEEHPNLSIRKNNRLTNVKKNGNTVTGAEFLNLESGEKALFNAKVFIDATYEGDLLAMAGCEFRLGRESKEEFGERFAGRLFLQGDRFMPGSTGEADEGIQNYNFRICMSQDPNNRIPVEKPSNYSREYFLPILEDIKAGRITKFDGQLVMIQRIPNQKADVNDKGNFASFSLALWGGSHRYPEGSPEVRDSIFQIHKDHALGLIWFAQNDPEIPENFREKASIWGLAKDEYTDNENFTPMLYVREGRRVVGEYMFREQDTQQASGSFRSPFHSNSIAVGDYGLNSHGVSKRDPYHPNIREGHFGAAYANVPHQIPYGVMVPEKIDGLLVPVAISATHVGFSALRMEPIWSSLGMAAGLAASIAIDEKQELRNISITELQKKIHESGGITIYFSDVLPDSPYFRAAQFFGQKGFFNHIPAIDNVRFIDHLKFVVQGQYRKAFPYHSVDPERLMDERLLHQWLNLVDYNFTKAESQQLLLLTRGEFLNTLYQKINLEM